MQSAERHSMLPGWRILIAGTGGQGVLTAARLLCDCFVELGHEVVSGQLHGMAQRGGSVQSTVIMDGGISPVIAEGRADFVVGFEPAETARALSLMSSRTVVYMNTAPVVPFVVGQRLALKEEGAAYPEVEHLREAVSAVAPRTFALDASRLAEECGSLRALNMVMLGCLLGSGLLSCRAEAFWAVAERRMPAALRATNARAFRSGAEIAGGLEASGAKT